MFEPLVKSIDVPCDQEKAFTVFLDMASWWPTERFATSVLGGHTLAELRIDAREGGQIVETGSDGGTHVWGVIRSYDPFDYLNLDFHVPHPSEENPGFTTVEVRFTRVDEGLTRVELTQSNWEGLGDMAEMAQGGYRGAWGMIFEGAYTGACGG